jgi:DNA-binding winged helix-turn-helix (wHTH) protein
MSSEIIPLGARQLDRGRNILRVGDAETPISPLATRFLLILAEKPGEVVTRDTLIDRLWNGNALIGATALNRVVSELRKAAGDSARAPTLVQTIPRKGYRLVPAQEAAIAEQLPPPAWSWAKIGALFVALILGAALLNWVLEAATGLVWSINNAR